MALSVSAARVDVLLSMACAGAHAENWRSVSGTSWDGEEVGGLGRLVCGCGT